MGLIALLCAGLSILQYRWTGDVSRAERARLGSGLSQQAGRLAQAFDEELRENCRTLLPEVPEIREDFVRVSAFARRCERLPCGVR